MTIQEQWPILKFIVPAMSVDVITVNKLTGRKIKKVDDRGQQITDERIIPKERPRFAPRTGHAYTAQNTVNFERWIRKKFFEAYPGNCGTYYNKQPMAVHNLYMGCRAYGEDRPCARYRQGSDFLDCNMCTSRRKNLCLLLDVYLKDERHIDLDNTVKIVLDALNKVCFYDDSQFVAKDLNLFCYAEKERLDVTLMVKPVQFVAGSLVGAYSIKKLPIKEAEKYIMAVAETVSAKDLEQFKAYLLRCDDRKYMMDVVETIRVKEL